jgi:hypothetical protein
VGVVVVGVLIAGVASIIWVSPDAAAAGHSCGTFRSDSAYPRAKVFTATGVGCNRALRVAKRFDHQGSAPGSWQCFIGHGGRRLFACGYPLPAAGGPITEAKHAFWVRGVGAKSSPTDHKPPLFAGLSSATTCIPGPISPAVGRNTPYYLRWNPASDDQTPASQIVYDVYQSSTSGGEDFSAPTYTTAPGASSFTTPPLTSSSTWFFVVRARDRAGNRDSNRVERMGQNLCV